MIIEFGVYFFLVLKRKKLYTNTLNSKNYTSLATLNSSQSPFFMTGVFPKLVVLINTSMI